MIGLEPGTCRILAGQVMSDVFLRLHGAKMGQDPLLVAYHFG